MTHSRYGRPVWAEIDLAALQHNVRELRTFLGGKADILAVVKAEAYGHGPVEISRQLEREGIKTLAVASFDEAVVLREAGVSRDILVLGYTPAYLYLDLQHYKIEQSIISAEMLADFTRMAAQFGPLPVQGKIDSGMGRLGVRADEAVPFLTNLFETFGNSVQGIFTHFAVADRNAEDSRDQLRTYLKVLDPFYRKHPTLKRHAANSAGTISLRESWLDGVRPGLLLYGTSPIAGVAPPLDLRPVMRVKARVVQVKKIRAGESVGYGHRFHAERDSHIAIIPIGYGDGYPRALSERSYMLLHGKHAPVIGNMSMDFSIVDVTDIANVKAEDEAVVLGGDITAWSLADLIQSIPYEIFCGLGKRISRIYLPPPDATDEAQTPAAPAPKN